MGATSRALGALLCVGCAVIVAFYIMFPLAPHFKEFWIFHGYTAPMWIVLPVVIGVLVLAGLGFWLGWIMATTKDVSPPSVSEEPKKKRAKRKK